MAEISFAIREAVVKYIRALNQNGIRAQKVLLYGSYAKNAAHADSDIDLIILSEDFAGRSLVERLTALGMARRDIPDPIQAYGFTPEEVKRRKVSAFWQEILDSEAVPMAI
jgi:predicted nucleotidyltransferase